MSLEDSIVKLTVAINKLNELLYKNKVKIDNKPNDIDNKKSNNGYITITEFCKLIGISKSTFYNIKDKESLKMIRVGKSKMIPKHEADKWINNR